MKSCCYVTHVNDVKGKLTKYLIVIMDYFFGELNLIIAIQIKRLRSAQLLKGKFFSSSHKHVFVVFSSGGFSVVSSRSSSLLILQLVPLVKQLLAVYNDEASQRAEPPSTNAMVHVDKLMHPSEESSCRCAGYHVAGTQIDR